MNPPLLLASCVAIVWTSVSCSKAAPAAASMAAVDAAASAPLDIAAVARAEDRRRANEVPADALRSHEVVVRRRAIRALARILDGGDAPVLRALADADSEVVAWAGYGLGESCRGREEVHVKALAARLVSLDPPGAARGPSFSFGSALFERAGPVDPHVAILRALGRCGGDVAEQTLRAWLRSADAAATAEPAAYALGDVAAKRGSLSLESASALLEAAERPAPVDGALYAFGRAELSAREDIMPRLLSAARAALGRPGPSRFFAVRALGRAGAEGAGDLARVLSSADFTAAERGEAARALGRLHKAGQEALGDALAAIVQAREASFAETVAGDLFGVLLTATDAVEDDAPKKTEGALWALARWSPPAGASAPLVRRASALRCTAAQKLSRAAWESDLLAACDLGDGEAGERARLAALDRAELVRSRRAAWLALARSPHTRVREAAIEAIARHAELGDAARVALAEALAAPQAGVVAAAAGVVHAHPDRVYVLAASERRAALDPQAPPPSTDPAREVDSAVARAMAAALARPWSEDLVETRVALVDASLALRLPEGHGYAAAACKDDNETVRARAAKALAAAGEKDAACPAHDPPREAAPEIGHELARATRVVFETDAGSLGIRFDPSLAPVAATRFVALARSGFYTGVVVHRVVPGFVVQFGDRGGDGYGGSGESLRCETSPVPFGALDVGVALAGRDTGSSQLFVVLARHPHLDGGYARVGRADGDWDSVAEGDVIRAVRVEE
jgi:cyclophilin family peptidyl-prolyl cis-trans isomerase